MNTARSFVLAGFFLLPACDPEGEGSVTVTAYGESLVEEGIPASEVADGWAVEFSRFDVAFSDVNVADTYIDVPLGAFDVREPSGGEGHVLGSAAVLPGDYVDGSFTIERVEVEGTATKGDVSKTFEWIFEDPTLYMACDSRTTVEDGEEAVFQITLHADHLLYDSLVSRDPGVQFGALAAADTDDDGAITPEELAATDIGSLDPGSDDVDDLWTWLTAHVRTLGHVNGEGHCLAVPFD